MDDSAQIIARQLVQPLPHFPQPEPAFDTINNSTAAMKPTHWYHANLVRVVKGTTTDNKIHINSLQDVYAKPQRVIEVQTPSYSMLEENRDVVVEKISELLNNREKQRAENLLKTHRNKEIEQEIKKQFGITMWVPARMTKIKTDKGFAWYSDNSAEQMVNLCIYTFSPNVTPNVIQARKEILQRQILGEKQDIYMQTMTDRCAKLNISDKGKETEWWQGTWQMHNDIMGGVFILKCITHAQEKVVAEVFVYAPGKKKRNIMNEAQAILSTVK